MEIDENNFKYRLLLLVIGVNIFEILNRWKFVDLNDVDNRVFLNVKDSFKDVERKVIEVFSNEELEVIDWI